MVICMAGTVSLKTCVESHQNLRYCKFLQQWHFKTLIPVCLEQPILANSSVFQVIPAFSSPSQSLIAYSSQLEASLSCSSLYKHIPAYYSPIQDIPDFYSLLQLIQAFFSLYHLNPVYSSFLHTNIWIIKMKYWDLTLSILPSSKGYFSQYTP